MKERGLSGVVTSLIIILVSLVAIGVISLVVFNLIEDKSSQADLSKITLGLNILDDETVFNRVDKELSISVKRDFGQGELKKVRVVVYDEGGSYSQDFPSLGELETKGFEIDYEGKLDSEPISVAVFPVFDGDSIGEKSDEQDLTKIGIYLCGNGKLEAGEQCDDGNYENGDYCSAICEINNVYFVRPLGGSYGTENGSSYENAWDGLKNINWNLIQPGDTIYISGTHIYGTHFTTLNDVKVYKSGTQNRPITLRGDYAGDEGIIISARRIAASSFTSNGDGTYYAGFSYHTNSWMTGNPWDESGKLPWTVSSQTAVVAKDGSVWYDSIARRVWVNPYGDQMLDVYGNFAGTALDVDGQDYIDIRGLKLYAGAGNDGVLRLSKSDTTGADHVNIWDCEVGYGSYTGIYSGFSNSDTNNILIQDTIIHRSKSGTYTISAGSRQFINWTFRRVEAYSGEDINDIYGGGAAGGRPDRHALGGQNMENLIIEDSYIHDWVGDGIINYLAFSDNDINDRRNINNVIIRNNRIINLYDTVPEGKGNYHYGIARHGDNGNATINNALPERAKNWSIYNNIFVNLSGNTTIGSGIGAAFRNKGGSASDGTLGSKFYNNVIVNSNYGVYGAYIGGSGSGGVEINNNIFMNPKEGGYHIFISTLSGGVDSNNNIFYPDGRFAWNHQTKADLATWRTSSGQDLDSSISSSAPLDLEDLI